MKKIILFFSLVLCVDNIYSQGIWYGNQIDTTERACLFAHMISGDYGRLYYAISLDGFTWKSLNGGKRINYDYRGHPDICKGNDGSYYLIGNDEKVKEVKIWKSEDLITWTEYSSFIPDYSLYKQLKPDASGAPKLFYDAENEQYIITLHTSPFNKETYPGNQRWKNMRTYYITSPDLKEFAAAKRLFQFDIPTIDVILKRDGDLYYAILKDEGIVGPTYTTGKSIRICWSESIEGPWSEPIDKILPNWCEAPTAIVNPNGKGWMVFAERYSAIRYELVVAPSLKGPFTYPYAGSYSLPPKAKHGGMINITREEYDKLVGAFGF